MSGEKFYKRRPLGFFVTVVKMDDTHVTLRHVGGDFAPDFVLSRRIFEADFVAVRPDRDALGYIRDLIQAGIANSSDFGDLEQRSPDWINGYRAALTAPLLNLPIEPPIDETATLELKLARCLADAIDTPVMCVRDTLGGPEIELRLGAWLPEISERAAELLDEAGL